jgi:hypothetical protein
MPLPLLAVLFVVLTVGGAVIMGPIGILGGAGAAVLAWLYYGQLLDALAEDRERRERGEPPAKPFDIAALVAIVLASILIGLVAD